jgi:large subunit ribosomal protein L10
MKTKQQKAEEIAKGVGFVRESKSLIFADFTGVGVEAVKRLKKALKPANGSYRVIKKRLLGIALKRSGVDIALDGFKSQLGTVFLKGDISSAAGTVYKFAKDLAKEKQEFKVVGAYDIETKQFLDAAAFTTIAKLPTREVLLGQLMGILTAPIRSFMYVLGERGKNMVEVKS